MTDHTDKPSMIDALEGKPMIDSRQASIALQLPYYWFAHRSERLRRRIPHYMLGTLVRFRLDELLVWARQFEQTETGATDSGGSDA